MTSLPASVTATALMRLAERGGGFATVIAKGDPQSGTILLLLSERGAHNAVLERVLQPNGAYGWQHSGEPGQDVSALIEKRLRFDPDCWILELDTASAERFAAEMKQLD